MTATDTDLTTWPELPLFKQLMPEERLPRYFSFAVFVSVLIHAFLAFLLWVTVTDRMTVEPASPSTGTPLTVRLVSSPTLAGDSHNAPDREPEPAVLKTGPPDQRAQPSPERRIKTETVVTSKERRIPDSKTPEDKSHADDAPPSIDLKNTYRIAQESRKEAASEVDAASVMASKDQGITGSEDLAGKSPSTDGISSFSLEASYSIAREVGKMSMSTSEAQELKFSSRKHYLKKHFGITVKSIPYCGTLYSASGYFLIPLFIKNTLTDSGCTWEKKAVLEGPSERESERHKDEERVDSFTKAINDTLFSVELNKSIK